MNQANAPIAVPPAIKEIIHHWFAFFEGTTVSTAQQLDIFNDDIQLVHAGQHVLATGKAELQAWLNAVPQETSSHFVEDIETTLITPGVYEVTWQTPYQAVRQDGSVGGAIIRYQTRVTMTPQNKARFTFIQKTPFKANPNMSFTPSYNEHRAGALCCRMQHLIDNGSNDVPAGILVSASCAELISRLLGTPGNKHCCLLRFGCGDSPDILLNTEAGNYRLTLQQQPGWYPAIAKATVVE